MLFLSKRSSTRRHSSSRETCFSILGLFSIIGVIGGISLLIYGLVKGNLSGTIAGSVILGVSVFIIVILALVFICCFNNNNTDLNSNEQQSHVNQRRHKQNHHKKGEQTSSYEINVISKPHQYDQRQQQLNRHNANTLYPSVHNNGLTDNVNHDYIKQTPTKISPFVNLNQSIGSNDHHNYNSSNNLNKKLNNHRQY